jgi:hypothetical protein
MKQQLFGDVHESERSQLLRDNCDRLEAVTYMKPFGSNDLDQFKDELSSIAIEISKIEEDKKAAAESYNAELKPLKAEYKRLLTDIRLKSTEVKEDCFVMVDHENKMVGYYNAKGHLVQSRPARAQELQSTIFSVNRTGTNG